MVKVEIDLCNNKIVVDEHEKLRDLNFYTNLNSFDVCLCTKNVLLV